MDLSYVEIDQESDQEQSPVETVPMSYLTCVSR
jgi:hypothetical protein